jgi:sporulation protein YlmC with PRC-barrel domain
MVSLKSLLGKEVITSDGVYVGEVVDVEISEDWRVAKLIVRLERDAAKALGSRLALRPRGAVDFEGEGAGRLRDAERELQRAEGGGRAPVAR